MRRFVAALGVSSVLALAAACSPAAVPSSGDAAKAAPSAGASAAGLYAEFRLTNDDASKTPGAGKMYRSAGNVRMEFSDPEKGPVVIITSPTDTIIIGTENGKQTAIKLPLQAMGKSMGIELPDFSKADWLELDKGNHTAMGPCSAAGESGTLYKAIDPTDTQETCVTSDGVILQGKDKGVVVWETTKITRGPQDPALFQVPAGVEVMDMGALMKGMGAEMEKLMNGEAAPEQK